mgnify:CR=1 FL=1
MISKLKIIIEETDTKIGRAFDIFIQTLIFLSLIAFSIETLPNLDEQFKSYLSLFEIISVIVFTIEYLLRIFVADKKLSFVFSFYGLIDLIAILPFYIVSGVDLRSIRIFRLLRLFRILKIFRYNFALYCLAQERCNAPFCMKKEESLTRTGWLPVTK